MVGNTWSQDDELMNLGGPEDQEVTKNRWGELHSKTKTNKQTNEQKPGSFDEGTFQSLRF